MSSFLVLSFDSSILDGSLSDGFSSFSTTVTFSLSFLSSPFFESSILSSGSLFVSSVVGSTFSGITTVFTVSSGFDGKDTFGISFVVTVSSGFPLVGTPFFSA